MLLSHCIAPIATALAVVVHGRVWQATYVAAYQPTFGPQNVPYSGIVKLKFNHGIVSGTYLSESVRPDPLYGRTIAVSGNVSEGQITLNLQAIGRIYRARHAWRATAKFPAPLPSRAASTAFSPK